MNDLSKTCRLRALASEQRAKAASDPVSRREWEELAMQWHMIANVAGEMEAKVPQLDLRFG